jgi:hypothetical protein
MEEISLLLYCMSFYFTFFRFILLFSKFHERPRLIIYYPSHCVFKPQELENDLI